MAGDRPTLKELQESARQQTEVLVKRSAEIRRKRGDLLHNDDKCEGRGPEYGEGWRPLPGCDGECKPPPKEG